MTYLILKVDLSNQSSVIEKIPAEIIENEKVTFRDASQALIEKLEIEKQSMEIKEAGMIVQIQLSFSLRYYATGLKAHLEGDRLNVPEKATIEEVLKILRIPENGDKLFFVNDEQVGVDQVLQHGDVLHISPAIAGG